MASSFNITYFTVVHRHMPYTFEPYLKHTQNGVFEIRKTTGFIVYLYVRIVRLSLSQLQLHIHY